jgi:hypothetical protein
MPMPKAIVATITWENGGGGWLGGAERMGSSGWQARMRAGLTKHCFCTVCTVCDLTQTCAPVQLAGTCRSDTHTLPHSHFTPHISPHDPEPLHTCTLPWLHCWCTTSLHAPSMSAW